MLRRMDVMLRIANRSAIHSGEVAVGASQKASYCEQFGQQLRHCRHFVYVYSAGKHSLLAETFQDE